MFLVPQLEPQTLEVYNSQRPSQAEMIRLREEAYKSQLDSLHEHMKDTPALGQHPQDSESSDGDEDFEEGDDNEGDDMTEEGEEQQEGSEGLSEADD